MDEIILQCLTGHATAAQREQLRVWRARSPANEKHYQELRRSWAAAAIGESLPDVRSAPDAARVIRLAHQRGRRGARRLSLVRGLAAAAGWRHAAAATVAALVLGLAFVLSRPAENHRLVLGVDEIVTGVAENATIHLRDGTVIRLAGSSRLRVIGTLVNREVELSGRAYFAVESQPDRPFRIRTMAGDVHVLGTRFDLDADGDDLQLIVVQGRVAMDVRGREVEVAAGNVGRVLQGTVLPLVQVPDIHRLVDWKSRFLAFQETPLAVAAAEIAATYEVRVEILDDVVAERTITTWFADRTLEEVLRIVCAIVDAECSADDDVVRIRSAMPS